MNPQDLKRAEEIVELAFGDKPGYMKQNYWFLGTAIADGLATSRREGMEAALNALTEEDNCHCKNDVRQLLEGEGKFKSQ